MSILRNLIIKF